MGISQSCYSHLISPSAPEPRSQNVRSKMICQQLAYTALLVIPHITGFVYFFKKNGKMFNLLILFVVFCEIHQVHLESD